jgi:hypothetical protein
MKCPICDFKTDDAVEMGKHIGICAPSAASAGCQWVVHVIGPDDLIDQPDEVTALREANALNVAFAKDRESVGGDPNYPFMMAVAKQVKVCVHGKPEDIDCHDCNW